MIRCGSGCNPADAGICEQIVDFEPGAFRQQHSGTRVLLHLENPHAFRNSFSEAPHAVTFGVLARDRSVGPAGHQQRIRIRHQGTAQKSLQLNRQAFAVGFEKQQPCIGAIQDGVTVTIADQRMRP